MQGNDDTYNYNTSYRVFYMLLYTLLKKKKRLENLHTVFTPMNRGTGWKHFPVSVTKEQEDCLFLHCGQLAPVLKS